MNIAQKHISNENLLASTVALCLVEITGSH